MTTVEHVIGGTAFVGEELSPQLVDLRIEAGAIAEIMPPGSLELRSKSRDVDARDAFVLPGFVDCHDHFRNLTPGLPLGEGLSLDEFLKVMWELGRLMGPEEYRLGAILGSLQRLRAGITSVVDHAYTFHQEGLEEAVLSGLAETGIRAGYARGIMTRPYEPVSETWEAAEARIRGILEWGAIDPSRFFVAPVSIRQSSPQDYRRAAELAAELDVALYTHVAETSAEIDLWRRESGTTPIHALDSWGFINKRTVLVHCVQLDSSEIDLLAERQCHVIHCPTNHMKLAKGFTPVPELRDAGVNVALGVDMMADMLMEMRTEVGMHAVHRQNPRAMLPEDALRMATANGARALGWGHVGTIDVGKQADLVIVDGRNIDHGPVIDPVHNVVYTANSGMIRQVLVGGEVLVADGRCLTIDEESFHEELEQRVVHYLDRAQARQTLWWRRDPARS